MLKERLNYLSIFYIEKDSVKAQGTCGQKCRKTIIEVCQAANSEKIFNF